MEIELARVENFDRWWRSSLVQIRSRNRFGWQRQRRSVRSIGWAVASKPNILALAHPDAPSGYLSTQVLQVHAMIMG